MSRRPYSQDAAVSRPGKRRHHRPRGRDWGAVGCALALALYAISEAKLHLPRYGLAICGVAAVVSLTIALGWWRTLGEAIAHSVGRALRQLEQTSGTEAAVSACADAASSLAAFLSQYPVRTRDPRRWTKARMNRHVLAAYEDACRWKCIAALVEAESVVDVPAEIRDVAAVPRSIADLYSLELWFATAAGALRDAGA